MKTSVPVLNIAVVASLLMLAGCNMTSPSQYRTGQIQLEETAAVSTYDVRSMNRAQAEALVRDHSNRGRGEVTATVAYLRGDQKGLQEIQRDMRRIAGDMRQAGLRQVRAEYVAVDDARLAGQATFSFPALTARAPDYCTRLPGYQGAETFEEMQAYQISCEHKSILSQMIVRPDDLLGNDGKGMGTSRRSGTVVEAYQQATPTEPFYNIGSASGVGQ